MGCSLKQNGRGKVTFEQIPEKGEGVNLVNTQGLGNMFQAEGIVSELDKAGWSSWRWWGQGRVTGDEIRERITDEWE